MIHSLVQDGLNKVRQIKLADIQHKAEEISHKAVELAHSATESIAVCRLSDLLIFSRFALHRYGGRWCVDGRRCV